MIQNLFMSLQAQTLPLKRKGLENEFGLKKKKKQKKHIAVYMHVHQWLNNPG